MLVAKITAMALAAMILAGLGGSATAGPLGTDSGAYNDGTRVWSGTSTLINPTSGLAANIDWCVYAPGHFPGTAYTYNSATSTHLEPAANEFVYVYQLESVGSVGVSSFGVQMLEGNKAHAIGHDTSLGLPGGVSEDNASFAWGGSSWSNLASWDFYAGLTQGQNSPALAFASVNVPWMLQGRIVDEGTYAYGDMASPSNLIPEPATLTLLATGLVLALRRRRAAR
jgi:hypothetical protein